MSYQLVLFSGVDASIIQISASDMDTKEKYNCYVRPPNGYIPRNVAKLTEIEMHGLSMYYQMRPVKSVDTKSALEGFRDWLARHQRVILIAHNVQFDSKVLFSACQRYGITILNVVGFSDTLSMFNNEFPGRQGAGGYSQQVLVRDILGQEYKAHNATEDVELLLSLIRSISSFKEKLNQHIMSPREVLNRLERIRNEKSNLSGYTELVNSKIISKANAKVIAGSGLTKTNMQLVNTRSGISGLTTLLKDVVKTPKIVAQRLHDAFASQFHTAVQSAGRCTVYAAFYEPLIANINATYMSDSKGV